MKQGKGTISWLWNNKTKENSEDQSDNKTVDNSNYRIISFPKLFFFQNFLNGKIERTYIASNVKFILSTGEIYMEMKTMDFIYPV